MQVTRGTDARSAKPAGKWGSDTGVSIFRSLFITSALRLYTHIEFERSKARVRQTGSKFFKRKTTISLKNKKRREKMKNKMK